MRPVSFKTASSALTLIEVLVVCAVIGVLLLFLVPTFDHRPIKAPIAQCASNLKQIGLGLHLFATDHGDQFPSQVSITDGGSMGLIGQGRPAAHFLTLSNYVPQAFKIWICPTDAIKHPATNYAAFDDRNLSYFLSMTATPITTHSQFIILAGDRHLEVAGAAVRPGLLPLTTNAQVGWTGDLHGGSGQSPGGNLLFVDNHVEFLRQHGLVGAVRSQGLVTNLVGMP